MGKKSKNVEENSPESITYEKSDERDENLEEANEKPTKEDDSKEDADDKENKEHKETEDNNLESEEVGKENGKLDAEDNDCEKKENDATNEISTKKEKNQIQNEESDKEKVDGENSDEEPPLGTLDQPVVILENKRPRKSITKYDNSKDVKRASLNDLELDYSLGKGVLLKEIPFIKYQIHIAEPEDLVVLHRLMYRKPGKLSEMKQNIRNFCGYPFDEKSKHYTAAKTLASRITTPGLKFLNGILGLEVSKDGLKMENDILEFLKEPKDLGLEVPEKVIIEPRKSKRKIPKRRGRRNPRRNQGLPKGYAMVSESDGEGSEEDDDAEESKDEKPATRGRRSNSSKKMSVKSEKEDSDDESEGSEDEKISSKRKVPTKGTKNRKRNKEDSDSDDNRRRSKRSRSSRSNGVNNTSDSDGTEEESDSEKENVNKKQKTKKKGSQKVEKEKTVPTRSSGRTSRRASKKDMVDEDEESSASDDEPLSKRNKKFPTNAELKKVISKILKGVNLDSVTMKNIVLQVYDKYPSLDLVPKKEFIKKTVKDML